MVVLKVERHMGSMIAEGDRNVFMMMMIISYRLYCIHQSTSFSHIGMDKGIFYVSVPLKSHYWCDGR